VTASDTFELDGEALYPFDSTDAGVQATRTTVHGASSILWTAKYGGDDGNGIEVAITNPGANNATIDVVVAGDDIDVSPATDNAGNITSTVNEIIAAVNASSSAAALLTASLAAGTGTGLVTAAAAADLAGGEDGKLITITGYAQKKIATLIDERTVLVGSHLTPAALTVADGLTGRKDPNFPTSAGVVKITIVAAGSVAAANLTLRQAVYATSILLSLHYSTVRSARLLHDETIENDTGLATSRRAFYLSDPNAYLREIVDDLTVAGVVPRFR
jgi:hypothetical protein